MPNFTGSNTLQTVQAGKVYGLAADLSSYMIADDIFEVAVPLMTLTWRSERPLR